MLQQLAQHTGIRIVPGTLVFVFFVIIIFVIAGTLLRVRGWAGIAIQSWLRSNRFTNNYVCKSI